MDEQQQPAGASFQRLAETVLNTVRNRLELLGIEISEEQQWFVSSLCWAAAGLFCVFTAAIVVTFSALILVTEELRFQVAIAFCLLYLLGAGVALLMVRRKLRRRPPPFQETIAEIRKDIACLRARE